MWTYRRIFEKNSKTHQDFTNTSCEWIEVSRKQGWFPCFLMKDLSMPFFYFIHLITNHNLQTGVSFIFKHMWFFHTHWELRVPHYLFLFLFIYIEHK